MPYHLTAHEPFTERSDDNIVRIWKAGEDVVDPADVARLSGNPFFVRHWVDGPVPTPAPVAPPNPPTQKAAVLPDPADAPVKS